MKPLIIASTLFALPMFATAQETSALNKVTGSWVTANGNATIDISDCGDGTPCGVIANISLPAERGDLDINNSDPALRDRPLVGAQMIWGFSERSGGWRSGKIYNAENGKTYGSSLKRANDGTLEVKGCLGPICRTQVWTPAE